MRRSCTPPGSVQVSSPRSSSPFSTAARYSVRKSGNPSVSSLSRGPSIPASGTVRPTSSSTESGLNLSRVRARRHPRPPGLGEQFSQAVSFRDLLRAPGKEHAERFVVEAPDQVGQQAQGGVVGPVQVVEKEHARGRTVEDRQQDPDDLPEEAAPGARRVERRGRRRVRGVGRAAGGTPLAGSRPAGPSGGPRLPGRGRRRGLRRRGHKPGSSRQRSSAPR